MKRYYVWLLIMIISACTPVHISPFANVEHAMSRGDYQAAYRFLEDYFISPELGAEARNIYLNEPRLQNAAKDTFGRNEAEDSVRRYGNVYDAEKNETHRLDMYRRVATKDQYEAAQKAVGMAFNDIKAKNQERTENMATAVKNSRVSCYGRASCKAAFDRAQVFVSENATMRIQLVTDAIIETYNVTGSKGIALKVTRLPGPGDQAIINIKVYCRPAGSSYCYDRMLDIYTEFPQAISEKTM